MINFEDLTLGEIEEIELLLGRGIDQLFTDGQPKGRALRVLYFISKRRQDPKFTFEDTEKITQAEAMAILSGSDPK